MVGGSGPVRSGIIEHPSNATEGKGYYLQAGYFFPEWRLQPWAGFEQWNATNDFGHWYAFRVGMSYFFPGERAAIKVGYERVNTEDDIGTSKTLNSGKDTINTLVVGFTYSF